MSREDRTLPDRSDEAEYSRVDAMERDGDGNLRLYRRRGLLGVLRRQDVFHPAGEWLTVLWHPSGRVQVTTRATSAALDDKEPK